MTSSTLRSVSFSLGLLALASVLTGCTLESTAPPTATPGVSIQGTVYGGSTPFVLTQIYLYAAGTSGYGGPSVSLLTNGPNTAADTAGNFHVISDANGQFNIAGDYTCSPGAQVYLAAFGGRPGDSNILANTGAEFLAGVGTCPSTGTFAANLPHVVINEVTTVATAYALAGFMTDASHVSSSGTALAQTGVANAFANIGNLASITSGYALATTPTGGVAPQATLNTLANILATCINTHDTLDNPSNGVLSNPCHALFSLLSNDGTPTGVHPGDTVTAILDIAHFPAYNTAALFGLPLPTSPFQPNLTQAPTDWTLGISFSNGFNAAGPLGIDAAGNVWIGDGFNSSLVKLSSSGAALSPTGGWGNYTGTNGTPFGQPISLAIDTSGYVWIADGNSVAKFSSNGVEISPAGGYGLGYSNIVDEAVAIDGLGNVWTANQYPFNSGSLSKLSNTGGLLSPSNGYPGGVVNPFSIALDGAGNAWVQGGNSLSKLSNSGTALIASSGTPATTLAIAVDASGNPWATNSTGNWLTKFNNAGNASVNYIGGGLSSPNSIAIDGAGNLWIANDPSGYVGYWVSEFSNSGAAITPSTGYASALFGQYLSPSAIAVDGSGNVWISCNISSSGPVQVVPTVLELVGAATPVITPIAAGLPSTLTSDGSSNLGTRP